MFNLVSRLNELRLIQSKLDIEQKEIIPELWDMIPSLPIDVKKVSNYGKRLDGK